MTELVAAAILGPIVLGLFLLIARRIPAGVRNFLVLLGTVGTGVVLIILWTMSGSTPQSLWYVPFLKIQTAPMFLVDGVGLLLAVLFSFIWLLVSIYSFYYMREYDFQHDYYAFLLIMYGAVVGLCLSQNLILIYAFWEIAGVATWRLVAFYRGEKEIRIAQKTILLTFSGSVLMLVGFAMVFIEQYTLAVTYLPGGTWSILSALLVLAGMLTKSASMPFYVWLPDAHTAAPSPMSALLSGIVAKIGLIAYLRVFVQSRMTLPDWWPLLLAVLGLAGSLVAAGNALWEKDYKRILALSTVSQLGYIVIGFAYAQGLGLTAAILYLIAHSLAKSGLFLALGSVERATHKRSIEELGGLAHTMPVTAACIALLALSVVGLPPLLGFWGKLYVVIAALKGNLVIAVGAIVAAAMTVLYLLRLYKIFVGEPVGQVGGREYPVMSAVVIVLTIASVALGLAFPFVSQLLSQSIASSLQL